MFDYEGMKQVITEGLAAYLKCPVIRGNQNAEPPAYPYVSYNVITPMGENKGTYGVHDDDTARKEFTQTWSITVLSDNDNECVNLSIKAREWFDCAGTVYLNDNDVVVQSVGVVTNRDNVLTIDYEYRKGFDVIFNIQDVVDIDYESIGTIEQATISNEL